MEIKVENQEFCTARND